MCVQKKVLIFLFLINIIYFNNCLILLPKLSLSTLPTPISLNQTDNNNNGDGDHRIVKLIKETFFIPRFDNKFLQCNAKCVPIDSKCINENIINSENEDNTEISDDQDSFVDIRMSTIDSHKRQICDLEIEKCCGNINEEITTTVASPINQGCGYRNNDNIHNRIAGTSDISGDAEFPWMVAILLRVKTQLKTNLVYKCGGSLIHPRVVLTVAHCVETIQRTNSNNNNNNNLLMVRAGQWNMNNNYDNIENINNIYKDSTVEQIIIHHLYNNSRFALYNDIALLILTNSIGLAKNINTICLPTQNSIFDGRRCIVTGWGKNQIGRSGKYHRLLKKLELPIVSRLNCERALQKTRLGRRFRLHESFICAGGEPERDACEGDGGSPLICQIDGESNRYYQIGIVAWGIGCGKPNVPGAYVNVPHFRYWIEDELKWKGFKPSLYQPI